MSESIRELQDQAIEELREEYILTGNDLEISEVISEIADDRVPVYTATLLKMALNDLTLATDSPELGPAFDGSPTPANIIAANIYEWLTEALWEYWNDEGEQLYDAIQDVISNWDDVREVLDSLQEAEADRRVTDDEYTEAIIQAASLDNDLDCLNEITDWAIEYWAREER